MPMQQVEYEFPDEKENNSSEPNKNVENEASIEIEVEGAVGREDIREKPASVKDKKADKAKDDLVIEVEDDTPPEDRNRKPSEPPTEVTDDELEKYSEGVQKRIKHFSKGYHDERRAKEQALREREAAEAYARQLLAENERLKQDGTKSQNALVESAKLQVKAELEAARRAYRDAYEAGDTDAIITAQEALNTAQIRMDRVNSFKPMKSEEKPLQKETDAVQTQPSAPQQQQVAPDIKAEAWRDNNPWFGSDEEMTAFALGYHNKIVKEGVDPRSDEYYEKINTRMRQVFPDQFDIEEDRPEEPAKRAASVVAPATRSTAPNKVKLTKSQVAIAKRLNVPLDIYAKQVAELQRKQ